MNIFISICFSLTRYWYQKKEPEPTQKNRLRLQPKNLGSDRLRPPALQHCFFGIFYVLNVVSPKVNAVTFCPPLYLSCYYLLIFSLGNFPSLSALLSTIV